MKKSRGERTIDLTYRKASELRPLPGSPRTHSKKQISQIADSIKQFGFIAPISIDETDHIISGVGCWQAAGLIGIDEVPTILLSNMTDGKKRAVRLAMNRLAELGGWDDELLAAELQNLLDADLDFDIEITGFDGPDIDRLLGGGSDEGGPVPVPDPQAPVISTLGDCWQVGRHRLICGDSRDPEVYEQLVGDELAQMAFCDPPYNVPIKGNVSGLGKKVHSNFVMASGEMSPAEFTDFLRAVMMLLVRYSQPAAIHYHCMDWKHIGEMLAAGEKAYAELKQLCVWAKTNAGMGAFYRSQHELVFVFKTSEGEHINNFGLGGKGRHRSNLWTYAGANTFREGRMDDLATHPTVKPTVMVADAILDCSHRGGIVLDAFAGSGTTLVAAERTGRRGYGIELDPAYVDVCLRRLQRETGEAARLPTGETFDDVERQRLAPGREAA